MSTTTRLTAPEEIEYPESDGEPMAENTDQYDWLTKIKWNLESVFRDDPNVFVAGDLFWYPVEGNNTVRRAPDVMIAFGRPKGRRGAYLQWREAGIAPQVVFEILSPGNRGKELASKFQFYETYGVEEYYIYDPADNTLEGWLRAEKYLRKLPKMNGWTSPQLRVRFELVGDELRLYRPDGKPFVTEVERDRQAEQQERRADEQTQQAEAERRRADEQAEQAEAERRRADEQAQQAEAERRRADEQAQQAEAERRRADEQAQQAEAERRRADEQQRKTEEQCRRADDEQRQRERLAAQLRALGIEPDV